MIFSNRPIFLGYLSVFHLPLVLVKRGVEGIKVFAVEVLLRDAEGIGEALIVHDLAFAQIFDGVAHVGIVAQAQNVVVGHARLLFCYYHVFATKMSLAKVRKILILQGITALWG